MTLRADAKTAVASLLFGGFVVVAAVNLPGHLSYDSVMQLNEGRRGFYANWHPPMMSWILGVFDAVVPGTALFTLFDIAFLFASLAVLYRLVPRPSRAAAVVLAVCLLTPQIILYQGIVWKDVLFANLAIAGFAALAGAAQYWREKRRRFSLVLAALLLLSVATLVRQNGGVVLPSAIAAISWLAWTQSRSRRLRSAFLYGTGATVAAAILVGGMHTALAMRIPGNPSPLVQFRLLQFYDLIGAIKAEPSIALPHLDDDDTDLETLMRTDGATLYTPQRNDTLAQSARLQKAYFNSPEETIPEEWWHLIAAHPGLYLRLRTDVFRWVFFTPDLAACRPVFSGVDGPPDIMRKLGLSRRFDVRDAALGYYSHAFEGTPVFSHLFFAIVAIAETIILFARRRRADIAMAFLLISAFAFTTSFFAISIACDYRYLYFLDLAALVIAFYIASEWRSAWDALGIAALAGGIVTAPREKRQCTLTGPREFSPVEAQIQPEGRTG